METKDNLENDNQENQVANQEREINVHVHMHENDATIDPIDDTAPVLTERGELRSIDLDELMINEFKGRIVRKDLTKQKGTQLFN